MSNSVTSGRDDSSPPTPVAAEPDPDAKLIEIIGHYALRLAVPAGHLMGHLMIVLYHISTISSDTKDNLLSFLTLGMDQSPLRPAMVVQ